MDSIVSGGEASAVRSSMLPAPVLAMEFVDGDTLENVIARNVARSALAGRGALPGLRFDRAWYYMQQVLGALAAGHALGIVHRDVKPSNILVRRDGIVKLTDYGIAHLVRPTHGERPPSPQELAPGTGAYMSPEQVLGRPPFLASEKSEFTLRMDQVEAAPPPIRAFVPQASPAVEQLLFRTLAKDPAMRFGSAIEMGDAFRDAFGIPSTPEWRALGEFARVVAGAKQRPLEAPEEQRMATLRQIVAQGFRTVPMPARPAPRF
jgi:serine/threonine protein kinase